MALDIYYIRFKFYIMFIIIIEIDVNNNILLLF